MGRSRKSRTNNSGHALLKKGIKQKNIPKVETNTVDEKAIIQKNIPKVETNTVEKEDARKKLTSNVYTLHNGQRNIQQYYAPKSTIKLMDSVEHVHDFCPGVSDSHVLGSIYIKLTAKKINNPSWIGHFYDSKYFNKEGKLISNIDIDLSTYMIGFSNYEPIESKKFKEFILVLKQEGPDTHVKEVDDFKMAMKISQVQHKELLNIVSFMKPGDRFFPKEIDTEHLATKTINLMKLTKTIRDAFIIKCVCEGII